MIEEDLPRPTPRRVAALPLDGMGVGELETYVAELRAEIARAEGEMARKTSHRSAADRLFRPG